MEQLTKYIRENQDSFYRVSYSYVKNKEDAIDAVQEAILKGIGNVDKLRKIEYLRTWFYRILINESINSLRKQKKHCGVDKDVETLCYEDGDTALRLDVYDEVSKLPLVYKTIIILRFYEEMRLEDIAKVTNTNLSTVKSRLYRGLEKLKPYLQEER